MQVCTEKETQKKFEERKMFFIKDGIALGIKPLILFNAWMRRGAEGLDAAMRPLKKRRNSRTRLAAQREVF